MDELIFVALPPHQLEQQVNVVPPDLVVDTPGLVPVSYTHLTLPTIYSV